MSATAKSAPLVPHYKEQIAACQSAAELHPLAQDIQFSKLLTAAQRRQLMLRVHIRLGELNGFGA
jgi:hypothetical protein